MSPKSLICYGIKQEIKLDPNNLPHFKAEKQLID
jgi:hypothetical protein